MSRNTIRKGLAELEAREKRPKAVVETRLRREGGGRKCLTETDPGLLEALKFLVEPTTRGDPMSALRLTCKSTARLAEELTQQAHPVGAWTVGALLRAFDMSGRRPLAGDCPLDGKVSVVIGPRPKIARKSL